MTTTKTETILRQRDGSMLGSGKRSHRSWTDVALNVWGVLVMLFLFAPIIVIVVYSFNTGRLLVSFDSFGFDAFLTILDKPAVQNAVRVSIITALISAVIGLVILPWNMYNSPVVIGIFLNGLGALLGPLFGIIMVDYWLIKKQRINVLDLYTENNRGEYHYRNGFNPRAVAALIISGSLALILTFVPLFHAISSFSWFIAASLGALTYAVLADRRGPFTDVDGEEIAVAPTH